MEFEGKVLIAGKRCAVYAVECSWSLLAFLQTPLMFTWWKYSFGYL